MRKTALLAILMFTSAAPACEPLHRFALEPDWYGGMTVPARIGGHEFRLLVDTGGIKSTLTESAAKTLNLPKEPITWANITLYGGKRIREFIRIPAAEIGAAEAVPDEFFVMPDTNVPYAVSGTLAPDFLAAYDVEFDFAAAEMRLYAPGACSLIDSFPLLPDRSRHLIAEVELDGRSLPALIDTGASRSDMSLETARRLFGSALRAAVPARRADAEDGIFVYPFETLTLGKVTVSAPDLLLVPDQTGGRPTGSPRLVLGMNILRHMKLFVAYGRKRLMLSRAD